VEVLWTLREGVNLDSVGADLGSRHIVAALMVILHKNRLLNLLLLRFLQGSLFCLSQGYSEGATASYHAHMLVLQSRDREGLASGGGVTLTQFALGIRAPSPDESVSVNCSAEAPSNAQVHQVKLRHKLWDRIDSEGTCAPEVQSSTFSQCC
jgi:hypothetical protein